MNLHFCLSIPSNSLWEALEMKARSQEKIHGRERCEGDGCLSSSKMIKAKNTIMKERIWINRVASARLCFSLASRQWRSVAR